VITFELTETQLAMQKLAMEAAVKVCLEALQIFGGMGVDRELPMEKYLRDTVTLLHERGTADTLRLKLSNLLAGKNIYGQPVR